MGLTFHMVGEVPLINHIKSAIATDKMIKTIHCARTFPKDPVAHSRSLCVDWLVQKVT